MTIDPPQAPTERRHPAAPQGRWGPDVLGAGFEARTFAQPSDSEGEVVCTLVRHRPHKGPMPRRPAFAVLYVHGWGDYFIQTEMAQFWTDRGAVFYAVDLRKSGRSLRPHQTPCYVQSLQEFDGDLDTAVDVIRAAHGSSVPLVLVAHSQGGLTSSLWAARRPGTVTAMALNAPFLEIHGSSLARTISHPLITQVARWYPNWPVPIPSPQFYERTVDAHLDGEWPVQHGWRPVPTHPLRPGWINAVMNGHRTVTRGLNLPFPILVLTSHRTAIGPKWRETMRASDTVLDVKQLWKRLPDLGPTVTLAKITDALHDVFLSPAPVRQQAYHQLDLWFRGYVQPQVTGEA